MPTVPASSVAGGALAQLFDSTLGAPATTIDTGASGVPQTANALQLVIFARTSAAAVQSNLQLTLNGDTGANYDFQETRATNATLTTTSDLATANFNIWIPGASVGANCFATAIITFSAYLQTAAHKACVSESGWGDGVAANSFSQWITGRWRNTAAITQITLTAGGGSNFATGSRMTIYGMT